MSEIIPKQSKNSIKHDLSLPRVRGLDGRLGIRELRALLAVADEGSFRQAAQYLGYTQSAVSSQIAILEGSLGIQLFTRPGGRGAVVLTAAGGDAYRHARRALSAVEAMAADARRAAQPGPVNIRVGAFSTPAAELLPGALRALSLERPDVEVSVSATTDTQDLISLLADGELDLAFALNPEPDSRIEIVPLFEDPWVIVTPRDNPITNDPRPSFNVLDGARLIAWRLSWRSQAQFEELLRQRGVNPVVAYRSDDTLALLRLVAAGFGHACIGRFAARSAPDPRLMWLEPREQLVPRMLTLCYPREREVPGAVMTLVSAIRAQAQAFV